MSCKNEHIPKNFDSEVRAWAGRLVADHLGKYPSLGAASAAVAKQVRVGYETVRRWVVQTQVDAGQRGGVMTVELAEMRKLKAENRRLCEDVDNLRTATTFFVEELDPRNR